jgi:hypothetical protein
MSAAQIETEGLTDVPNFRDLSSANIKIKKGHFLFQKGNHVHEIFNFDNS